MSEQNNQNTQESQTPHKRRVRYKGKYPKKFEEKYKELQPEKYKDTIAHVIQKGNTPAGMHISIMVNEILDFLKIRNQIKTNSFPCAFHHYGVNSKDNHNDQQRAHHYFGDFFNTILQSHKTDCKSDQTDDHHP